VRRSPDPSIPGASDPMLDPVLPPALPFVFHGRGIVAGVGAGPALVAMEPISFFGDVDIRTGRITGDIPSVRNASIRACVLFLPLTRGSAGAWRILHQLQKHGNAPAALVIRERPDPSVVQGAILGSIPIVCGGPMEAFDPRFNGVWANVDATAGRVAIGRA
jgi:predicted aconitase with swiveling domain